MLLTTNRETQKVELSVREAHVLWRILADRYVMIDHLNQLKNFTHDKDFLLYLEKIVNIYVKEVKELEKLLEKYSIAGPEPNAKDRKTAGNSEVVRDRETAQVLYGFMRMDIVLLLSSLQDVNTNDSIRAALIKLAKSSFERIDNYIEYLKLKDWTSFPPLYPYVQPDVPEKIATNEIYLLWDHLIFRYINIRQTQLYTSFASDPDFKMLLTLGASILEKQAKTLEEKLLYYGVTLPTPFTPITASPETTELMDDKYMFNMILRGIQSAISLHGIAIQEIIVNDKIRKFFIKLTMEELDYLNKIAKYGKTKGWVYIAPTYKGGA